MDRQIFYAEMNGGQKLDYEVYLNTEALLQTGAKHRFFPALWDRRAAMTDRWGGNYGRVRDSIAPG
jgi:hypothetical protein